jgi:hypothetical protein
VAGFQCFNLNGCQPIVCFLSVDQSDEVRLALKLFGTIEAKVRKDVGARNGQINISRDSAPASFKSDRE